ncbi:putative isomerase YddE [Fundidesulfovibrio magnetotacticus]|uniref:Putative isomerase YddE n=1 Tax=Fundidesulfovibrio magnetotacticus TaxID=2730080 RepID=A0A6V8M1W3_9BACT|nr:PhzF family phenazine biosynthesis protein [Fundidesulfovibrio magnetotacticus]GFK95827.1 putative isomerase YddE [Fundidesulfovibrio magnetotacticus]
MATRLWTVDAFAEAPFTGNPAGVCLLDRPAPAEWMQALARELNHSETAFLVSGEECFGLRWFTPSVEVDLCGHATLASAHVLWSGGMAPPGETIRFETASGRLSATPGKQGLIWLDFPAEPGHPLPVPDGLAQALGARIVGAQRNRMDLLVELESEEAVLGLAPDLARVRALGGRGLIVTSRAERPGADFVSRFFAPAAGIDEDPVTGSAHCFLGPYWSKRLGANELTGYQASSRGGTVLVELDGVRVRLGGRAVTIASGELAPRALPVRPRG